MADWTTLDTNGLLPGEPLTSEKALAFYNNPIAIAERASNAPIVLGSFYDYQEFISPGVSTWTKPSNAQTGDRVLVHVVAGGDSGGVGTFPVAVGGNGGAGCEHWYDIDDLPATFEVTVGAGGTAVSASSDTAGSVGGLSQFGPDSTEQRLRANNTGSPNCTIWLEGGARSLVWCPDRAGPSVSSEFGGGGGSGGSSTVVGASKKAGRGGRGRDNSATPAQDGFFPGGGGGGHIRSSGTRTSGAGANGVVRVWCFRN